jgi:hypothetical protein
MNLAKRNWIGEKLAESSQTSTSLWCTGQCPVPRLARRWTRRSREKATTPWLKFTGLSGVHRTVRWAKAACTNGRQRNQRATRGPRQQSVGHTRLSGAPTEPKVQRSGAPDKEGYRALDNYCSCPVVHRTIRCATRPKARIAFQLKLQRLLAALGL